MSESQLEGQKSAELSGSTSTAENSESKTANELSADEQMALYEKSLKEDDWGHQPC